VYLARITDNLQRKINPMGGEGHASPMAMTAWVSRGSL
jgi:hypothetical protein